MTGFEENWKLNNWPNVGESRSLKHTRPVEGAKAKYLSWILPFVDHLTVEDTEKMIGSREHTAVSSTLLGKLILFDLPRIAGSKPRPSEFTPCRSENDGLDPSLHRTQVIFHL